MQIGLGGNEKWRRGQGREKMEQSGTGVIIFSLFILKPESRELYF